MGVYKSRGYGVGSWTGWEGGDCLGSITQLTVAGDTSARFGRTPGKFDTLYVSTAGGPAPPVNGTVTEGEKVVAIDTRGFRI